VCARFYSRTGSGKMTHNYKIRNITLTRRLSVGPKTIPPPPPNDIFSPPPVHKYLPPMQPLCLYFCPFLIYLKIFTVISVLLLFFSCFFVTCSFSRFFNHIPPPPSEISQYSLAWWKGIFSIFIHPHSNSRGVLSQPVMECRRGFMTTKAIGERVKQ
jgi:hypothetical protein